MKDRNTASRGKIFLQIIFHDKRGRMFFQFLIYSFALKDPTNVQYPEASWSN